MAESDNIFNEVQKTFNDFFNNRVGNVYVVG